MARPKQDANTPSARERIETAFWEMLSEGPYMDITVSNLSRRAGVNHNTLYYYYENIDEMAKLFFDSNLDPQIPMRILSDAARAEDPDLNVRLSDDLIMRWKRACLFAKSDSAALQSYFKESIIACWLDAAGINEESLSTEDALCIDYIFGGITAIVSADRSVSDPDLFARLLRRNHALENLREIVIRSMVQ